MTSSGFRPKPLSADELCRVCDDGWPESLGLRFETTADLEPPAEELGQARALEALRFGARMRRDGYNLFVLGPPGAGRRRLVDRFLAERAGEDETPDDWCYAHRFDDTSRPRRLRMPPGRGAKLRDDLERLTEDLGVAVRSVFDSDEYRSQLQTIEERFVGRKEKEFEALAERLEERGVVLARTPTGFAYSPAKEDGTPLSPEEFQLLPEEERERLHVDLHAAEDELKGFVRTLLKLDAEQRDDVRALDREVTELAVGDLIGELAERYEDCPDAAQHLTAVREDVLAHADHFRPHPGDEGPEALLRMIQRDDDGGGGSPPRGPGAVERNYRVNLLVGREPDAGAPVVHEPNPTLQALVGRVEHFQRLGALMTDFTMIRPGALHRANGGYLVLDAVALLTRPLAWEGLKRALRAQEIVIESLSDALGYGGVASLQPEPIPLDVKVVLVGERRLYHLLAAVDPDFRRLFKVAAEYEDDLDRSDDAEARFVRRIAGLAAEEELRPLTMGGVARAVAEASRLAGAADKLTTHLGDMVDLLREADDQAEQAGAEHVDGEHVQAALDAQLRREGRLRERILEEIGRGTLHIATEGSAVGQVNGLSVRRVGRMDFGSPSRISAAIRLGKGGVVDIEREVELGGSIHSKGVMILSGFVGNRFGRDKPLALTASLVFEQSYGGVDGDSASIAETCALLSAISGAPLRQDLAVTGSMDQHGRAQAVGGVNAKIEGFFDVCAQREGGLTGEQGVLMPASNLRHLMLRTDVVEACRQGKFAIYPVEHVDQALALLTDLDPGRPEAPAPERGHAGYPDDTLNGRVDARLRELASAARRAAGDRAGAPDPDKD